MDDRIEQQLTRLPARPGVYLFRDAGGRVLYIGKAKSLRARVRTYFQKGGDNRAQIGQLPGLVADVEVIVTGTEAEIEAQLRRLAGLGVTEFWPIIFPAGGDPAGSRRETRALLTGLAAAS